MSTATLNGLRDYLYDTLSPELSERQFAEGKYQDFDEAMDELEEEFAEDEKVLEMSEAV